MRSPSSEVASSPGDVDDLEGRIDPGVALASLRKFIEVFNNGQGWESAGCTLWDLAVLPDQAATMVGADGVGMLQLVIRRMALTQKWRPVEISVGTLANIASHPDLRGALASNASLATTFGAWVLWSEDAATVVQACRLASAVLSASESAFARWTLRLRNRRCLA